MNLSCRTSLNTGRSKRHDGNKMLLKDKQTHLELETKLQTLKMKHYVYSLFIEIFSYLCNFKLKLFHLIE